MKFIASTRGFLNIVDDDKYSELSKHKWHTKRDRRCWYAARGFRDAHGKQHTMRMHCAIMGMQPGMEIDHITHEGEEDGVIDNRRENLRFCTHAQNMINQRKHAGCSSQLRCIRWHKRDGCWEAYIYVNGKQKFLGYFDTDIEAAQAYDKAAWEAWHDPSRLNFPRDI